MFIEKLTQTQANQILKQIFKKNISVYPVVSSCSNTFLPHHVSEKTKNLYGDELTYIWAEIEKNTLIINSFDHTCHWKVDIELNDFKIKVPKYENGFEYEKKCANWQAAYQNAMYEIFGDEYKTALVNNLLKQKTKSFANAQQLN